MAFALITSFSALITDSVAAVFSFGAGTVLTIKSFRLTNLHTAAVTVTLWFDYDGIAAGDVDCVLKNYTLNVGESVVLDGGPWNFAASSRISGIASVTNKVSLHFTAAQI